MNQYPEAAPRGSSHFELPQEETVPAFTSPPNPDVQKKYGRVGVEYVDPTDTFVGGELSA